MNEPISLKNAEGLTAEFDNRWLSKKHADAWILAAEDARAPDSLKACALILKKIPWELRTTRLDKEDFELQKIEDLRERAAWTWIHRFQEHGRSWREAELDGKSYEDRAWAEIEAGAQSSLAAWSRLDDAQRHEWIERITANERDEIEKNPTTHGQRDFLTASFPVRWVDDPQGARGFAPEDVQDAKAGVEAWLSLSRLAPVARAESKKAGLALPVLRVMSAAELAGWDAMSPAWARAEPLSKMRDGDRLFVAVCSYAPDCPGISFISPNGSAMGDLGRAKVFATQEEAEHWGARQASGSGGAGVLELKVQFANFFPSRGADQAWAAPFAQLSAQKEGDAIRAEIASASPKPSERQSESDAPSAAPAKRRARL